MTNISKFYSEDDRRRAEIEYTGNGFMVSLFINEQIYQRRNTISEDDAESIAEEFVLGTGNFGLLNEDLVGPSDC